MDDYQAKMDALREMLQYRQGQLDALKEREAQLSHDWESLAGQLDEWEQVRILLNQAAEQAREQAKKQIEMVVTNALQSIFSADLRFSIEMAESRGRVEAEFYVTSTYGGAEQVRNRPQEARGGGVVDVISLALRIVLMELTSPKFAGPIILDEPAKHVSDEFSLHVAEFLRSVSESFGRQVLMVTHNEALAESANMAYRIEIKEGRSVVKRVGEREDKEELT
jgi:DNA repair ATPase RecN